MPWKQVSKTDKYLMFENNHTGEQVRASRIYFHNELGVFYAFDNILQIPYQRKYIFDLAQQMERIGIEKDELGAKMQAIQDLCREKKNGFELEVYSIANIVQNYVRDAWDYQKTAMLVASLIIIQEGESIGYFDQGQAVEKINQWKKDPEMLSFFLSILSERCSPLTESFVNFTQVSSLIASQSKASQQ